MINAITPLQDTLPEITSEEVILSHHAQARVQQRGIKKTWIALVLEYGHYVYQRGKHTYTISLDKSGIKQIKQKFGGKRQFTHI